MVKHLICNQGLRVRFSVGPFLARETDFSESKLPDLLFE